MSEIKNAAEEIAEAVRRISYGDAVPTGIEALTMAICGNGGWERDNLCNALDGIARAIFAVSVSIDNHTEAIEERDK